jgi:hypothetical protein
VLLGFFHPSLKSLENLSFQNFVAILMCYDFVAREKQNSCRDDVPSTHTKYERVTHA